MTMRVSVLGPCDLVEKICMQGKQFNNFIMIPFPYNDVTETMLIVNSVINDTDLILFAGPIPYYIARENVEKDILMLYVSYSGTAFYKALFNIAGMISLKNNNKTLRISVDTIRKNDVEEILNELDIKNYEIYAKDFDNTLTSDDLVDYHYNLYIEDKVDLMITSLTSAYEKLKLKKTPVFRVVPTIASIRDTLKIANLELENIISKRAQLCVGIIKIHNWNKNKNYNHSEYELRRLKVAITEHFIKFCENIKASMKFEDNDEYVFYATRRVIENITNYYRNMPILQELKYLDTLKIGVGLGYGYTANESEKNSRDALEYSKKHNNNSCYVIMENRKVIGPIENGRIIEFYSSAQNSKIEEFAKRAGLSAMTINRVFGALDSYGRDTITSIELAEALNLTVRSVRRILSKLEQVGIANVIGEEQPIGKGRPRRIYKINT